MRSKPNTCWAVIGLLPVLASVGQVSAQQTVTIRDTLTKPAPAKVVYAPKATAKVTLKAIYGQRQDLLLDVSLNGQAFQGVRVGAVLAHQGTVCQVESVDLLKRAIALKVPDLTKATRTTKTNKTQKAQKALTPRYSGDLCPPSVYWTGQDERPVTEPVERTAPREVLGLAPLQLPPMPSSALSRVIVPAPLGIPNAASAGTPLGVTGAKP